MFKNNERGYVRCDVTPDRWAAEYRRVDTVEQPAATASTLVTAVIENGVPGARLA